MTAKSDPLDPTYSLVDAGSPATVELQAADLQGPGVVFCPNPKMPLWSAHPRVFIDVGTAGQGRCPYCGTRYKLAAGVDVHRH